MNARIIGTGRGDRFIMVAVVLLLAGTTASAARAADGMQCFRIKDPIRLKGVVDINTADFGLAADCKIGKATQYCVPASNTPQSMTSSGDPVELLSVFGPQTGAQICYKVHCPKTARTQEEVTDRFGHRTVERIKARTLCVPAVAGPPPALPDGMCVLPENPPTPAEFIPVCYSGGGPPSGTVRGTYDVQAPALRILASYEAPVGVPAGTAQNVVHVAKQEAMVLVLSAYEQTEWVVTADPGVVIERIIVVGYEPQFVTAPAGVPVTNLSPYEVAIAAGFEVDDGSDVSLGDDWLSVDTETFIAHAEDYTGLCLSSYHYCYGGGEMVIPDF